MAKARNKLLILGFLTALVFVGLFGYGDFKETGRQLANFPLAYLLAALSLVVFNYALRFIRWTFYLRMLNIQVPLRVSILIFLSGLSMSITPGKMGELVKSYLLWERTGTPISVSAPVVLMERLTDVISVGLLGLTGLILLPLPVVLALLIPLALCGITMVLITSRHSDRILKLPVLGKWESSLKASRQGLRQLTTPKALIIATILGAIGWLGEGVALWVIIQGLDTEVEVMKALPIYAAATLVGALSALPGGLVGTEGSMVAMLQQTGIAKVVASTSTLLVRLATLWFAVLIGVVAFICLRRLYPAHGARLTDSEQPETSASGASMSITK